MKIDEKGRVNGKISIIDLSVVIVLILAILGGALFFGMSLIKGGSTEKTEDDTPKIRYVKKGDKLNEFLVETTLSNVRDITLNALSVGDEVFSVDTRKLIGVIEKIEPKPLQEIVVGVDGKMAFADVPEKYDIDLYIRVWGVATETGCFTQYNQHLGYGDSISIKNVKINTSPVVKDVKLLPGKTKIADDPNKVVEKGMKHLCNNSFRFGCIIVQC